MSKKIKKSGEDTTECSSSDTKNGTIIYKKAKKLAFTNQFSNLSNSCNPHSLHPFLGRSTSSIDLCIIFLHAVASTSESLVDTISDLNAARKVLQASSQNLLVDNGSRGTC